MSEASKPELQQRLELRRLGSYTTARVERGRVTHVERHVMRLIRDAGRLGLAPPSPRSIEALFWKTAKAEFPRANGIVRLDWSRPLDSPEQTPELIATTRPLGDLARRWRAKSSETLHPGPETRRNAKAIGVPSYDAAREEMRIGGIEEVLLFSEAGWLVEGCRSNLIIVQEDGRWITPDLALGGVEGLGLEIIGKNRRELSWGRIDRVALLGARELIATNAVRGAVPIIEFDGRPVGTGTEGPVARALALLFGHCPASYSEDPP